MLDKVRAWRAIILRLTFRARMYAGESWVGYRERTAYSLRIKWRKMGLPTMAEEVGDKIWATRNWAIHDGDVPLHVDHYMVAEQKCVENGN